MIYKGIQYARAKKKECGSCVGCYFFENLSSLDCLVNEDCYDRSTETTYIWVKLQDTSDTEEYSI